METQTVTKRTFKDSVFRMLLKEPENALAVYNGLNGTNYTDATSLTYNTLENAVFMNMKNDVSFLIGLDMVLYEHQSTFTPNMPLRDLFYVADLLQNHVKDESLYSSKRITIPTPWFFVFYNGNSRCPDRMELRLSDSFENPVENPRLELVVTVLNINHGHNTELMKQCPVLQEYAMFVEMARNYSKSMEIKEAVTKTVDECIQKNILKDFLLKQKSEVIKMSIYEFDEERELALIRKAERELERENIEREIQEAVHVAVEEERQKTEDALKKASLAEQKTENALKKASLAEQKTEDALKKVSLAEQKTENANRKASAANKLLINILREKGKSRTEVIELLRKQCTLAKEEAEEQVNLYWD